MFYSTTWVGETYFRYEAPEDLNSKDVLGDIGRVGSFSLVIFSFVSFTSSVVLPWLVRSPEEDKRFFSTRPPVRIPAAPSPMERYKPDLLTAWTASQFIFAGSMILAPFVRSVKFATIIVSACAM